MVAGCAGDSQLFAVNGLDVAFDADAECPRWHAFSRQLWPHDQASIETLAEILGCLLVGEVRHQKIFWLLGPRRSGKGTIGRIATALIGAHNTCHPTLLQLAGDKHDHEILIAKQLAIVSDARLGRGANSAAIIETLLRVSGEDSISINRKYLREPWIGRLYARFLMLANELPELTDRSGALESRYVILRLTESFLGHENLYLTDELLTELSGILNFALDGWESWPRLIGQKSEPDK